MEDPDADADVSMFPFEVSTEPPVDTDAPEIPLELDPEPPLDTDAPVIHLEVDTESLLDMDPPIDLEPPLDMVPPEIPLESDTEPPLDMDEPSLPVEVDAESPLNTDTPVPPELDAEPLLDMEVPQLPVEVDTETPLDVDAPSIPPELDTEPPEDAPMLPIEVDMDAPRIPFQFDADHPLDMEAPWLRLNGDTPKQPIKWAMDPSLDTDPPNLPLDLLVKVFSYLSITEKFKNELVCKELQNHIFKSIKALTFESSSGEFPPQDCFEQNQLSCTHNDNDETMKYIISKCGRYLNSFKGFVSAATMQAIADTCHRLHSIDMRFDDVETFTFLTDTYLSQQSDLYTDIGKQITSAHLYENMVGGLTTFIDKCPNLTSFAIWAHDRNPSNSYTKRQREDDVLKLPQSLANLSNLQSLTIQNYVTEELLETLRLLPKLTEVALTLTSNIDKSASWQSLMTNWSALNSLSLTITEDCDSLCDATLPPNLEHLHVTSLHSGDSYSTFSTSLPALKTLNMYQTVINFAHLNPILLNIVMRFPDLEELSFSCSGVQCGEDAMPQSCNLDGKLALLLKLKFLQRLTLGTNLTPSDSFISKLFNTLDHLTSLGKPMWHDKTFIESYLPNGQQFWKALKSKAISRPSENFVLLGQPQNALELNEPLPPNVLLGLQGQCNVKLMNGFGISDQWLLLTEHSLQLQVLFVEIHDINLKLSALPKSLKRLIIVCLNDSENEKDSGLMFDTHLNSLGYFRILQENMSNHQLQETVSCVAEHCHALECLCLGRKNEVYENVDDCSNITSLLERNTFNALYCDENFVFSDEFKAKWIDKLYITESDEWSYYR